MGNGIQVTPEELHEPAKRFDTAALGLDLLARVITRAASQVSASGGSPVLSGAATGYGQAAGTVVDAFADESRLMATKLRGAAVVYRTTDETAVRVHTADVPPAGGRRAE
jgi:Excreted virulence factor EspC, type VII ESX diderm